MSFWDASVFLCCLCSVLRYSCLALPLGRRREIILLGFTGLILVQLLNEHRILSQGQQSHRNMHCQLLLSKSWAINNTLDVQLNSALVMDDISWIRLSKLLSLGVKHNWTHLMVILKHTWECTCSLHLPAKEKISGVLSGVLWWFKILQSLSLSLF